ncbi:nucleolar complex protein 14, partial [Spiromyces aspiralis]
MKEIIAKSKLHKLERQKAREEDEAIVRALDDDFGMLRSLLYASTKESEQHKQEDLEKPMPKAADEVDDDEVAAKKSAEYDRMVREMVYERRAKPQERLKTEEELALEEKERLERAERHRLRRMEGLDSDTEPEDSSDEDSEAEERYRSKVLNVTRAPQADDLDGDFAGVEGDGDEALDFGRGLRHKSSDEEDSGDEEQEEESESETDEGEDIEGDELS